jgi:nucleoside-diphosphate-sugar epimerase
MTFSGRVLVTGGRGFIGRRLLLRGAALGLDVAAFTGRLHELPAFPGRFNAVVHLAAATRPPADAAQRLALFETNVAGVQDVLHYCATAGSGVVLASTSGVYARREDAPPLDEDAPLDPASDYALSKLLAERLCLRQCRRGGLAGVGLRLFNVYGPGQPETFLVPEAARNLLAGVPVVLRAPEAVRDFVHVDDVVTAILAALERLTPGRFPVYNIGSGQSTRVRDLVAAAERIFGCTAVLDLSQASPARDRVVADAARAARELDWRPSLPLDQGLAALRAEMTSTGGLPPCAC